MYSVENLFDLEKAVEWINENSFKCVALELPVYLLKYSVELVRYLNLKLNSELSFEEQLSSDQTNQSTQPIEFYTVVLNCCSVDYISPRHLSGQVDAVIRFGKCCLANLPKGIVEYPVLFMFERHYLDDKSTDFMLNYLKNEFDPKVALLVMDTNCLMPTLKLVEKLTLKASIAKFLKFTSKWTFVDNISNEIIDSSDLNEKIEMHNTVRFYNYIIDRKLGDYKRLYYVGDRVPTPFKVLSLLEVVHLNPSEQKVDRIHSSRKLMKRCALIEKVKNLNKFGVVFTHAYPDVNPYMNEVKKLAKRRKKLVNFITLVQTTDQFKLGNFSAVDSIVLVNNCHCSNLIDTINLHIPLINYEEFKISCGMKIEYGQVKWNEELEDELSDEEVSEESNQLLLDNQNTALVENYLKEDKWFGLQVNAGQDEIGNLTQGLKGIAMGYEKEKVEDLIKNSKKSYEPKSSYTSRNEERFGYCEVSGLIYTSSSMRSKHEKYSRGNSCDVDGLSHYVNKGY